MSKLKTINIGKGTQQINYAKVSARLSEFLKAQKNSSIRTSYEFVSDVAVFKAQVIPDVTKPERYFTGTSMGKTAGLKALEKLETIAVGRALAFAGYLSDGEIASDEEMVKYEEAPPIDNVEALRKLNSAKNLDELTTAWKALKQSERNNEEVFNTKEFLKEGFSEVKHENIPVAAKK